MYPHQQGMVGSNQQPRMTVQLDRSKIAVSVPKNMVWLPYPNVFTAMLFYFSLCVCMCVFVSSGSLRQETLDIGSRFPILNPIVDLCCSAFRTTCDNHHCNQQPLSIIQHVQSISASISQNCLLKPSFNQPVSADSTDCCLIWLFHMVVSYGFNSISALNG